MIDRAQKWVLSMQCRDGGWAAFDLNNNKQALAHVPFAEFMSLLDPTCADVTAHVVEFLSEVPRGHSQEQIAFDQALRFLYQNQEGDGAWYGRWGVNYLYGTGLTLAALQAAGEDMQQEYIQKAVTWLCEHQNRDGGWGETCKSYAGDRNDRGRGPSTASQTAWALLGLLAANSVDHQPLWSGLQYLLETQQADGSWEEEAYTGTGFPRAFYLHYDLYRIYFPLMALARYQKRFTVKP